MTSATVTHTHRQRLGVKTTTERRADRRESVGDVSGQTGRGRFQRAVDPLSEAVTPAISALTASSAPAIGGTGAMGSAEPLRIRESRSFVRTLVTELDDRVARAFSTPVRVSDETIAERSARVKALVAKLSDREVAEIRAELTQDRDHCTQTRLALAVTTPLMQESLERLATDAGMAVVAHASNEALLLRKVHSYPIDVVLVDLGPSSPRVAREIRAARPGIAVLVLADDTARARDLLDDRPNGVGYILKDENLSFDRILSAITLVAQGGTVVDPRVMNNLADNGGESSIGDLTAREREVLQLIAEGLGNQMIAERLVVTKRAIEKHVNNIFLKLDMPPGNDYDRRVLAARVFELNAAA